MRPVPSAGVSRPAPGYSRFVGRVGALAIFLGVGTVLGAPTAAAESDGAAPSRPSPGATSHSAASSPGGTSVRGPRPTPRNVASGPSSRRAAPAASARPVRAPQSLAALTWPGQPLRRSSHWKRWPLACVIDRRER